MRTAMQHRPLLFLYHHTDEAIGCIMGFIYGIKLGDAVSALLIAVASTLGSGLGKKLVEILWAWAVKKWRNRKAKRTIKRKNNR